LFLIIGLIFLAFPALTARGDEADPALTVFDRIDQHVDSGKYKFSRGWLEKVNLIRGLDTAVTLPDRRIPSGTGILLKLQTSWHRLSPRTRTEITRRLTPPELPREETRLTADGNFRIHYTRQAHDPDALLGPDRDRNGRPDTVDRLENILIHCWDVAVEEMGWGIIQDNMGARYPGGILDVYVAGNRSAVDGFTFFKHFYERFDDLNSLYIQIPPVVAEDEASAKAAAAHLLTQALQFLYRKNGESWWHEGVATWMETRIFSDISRYRDYLNLRFSYPETALTAEHGLFPFSNALWAFFLSEKFGDGIILDICRASRRLANKSILAVTDRVLRENCQTDLITAFREYTIWNFFTNRRDDGNHYRLGAEWGAIRVDSQYDMFPMTAITEKNPLGYFGTSYFRFIPDGSEGGIILTLESLEPAYLIGEIITVSNVYPEVFDVIPVGERIHEGHLDIGIPWKNLTEIILVATRVDDLSPGDVRLNCTAVYDATIPVDFSSFVVNAREGENTLIWKTSRECYNFGFLVYRRSPDGSGAFDIISDSIIPAIGDSRTQTNYIYIDADVAAGGQYDYFIRAFTPEGLHYDSFVLSTIAR
jgi:hypothetical protein